jgi:hypothetical protein
LAFVLVRPALAFPVLALFDDSPPHPTAKRVSAIAVSIAASLFLFILGLLMKVKWFQKAEGKRFASRKREATGADRVCVRRRSVCSSKK